MCVAASACVNVAVCDHVVMLSEACDISCHASRTLQRHASRAPRDLSPRIHICLPEMPRNKRQKPREVFCRAAPKRRPFGPICVTLECWNRLSLSSRNKDARQSISSAKI